MLTIKLAVCITNPTIANIVIVLDVALFPLNISAMPMIAEIKYAVRADVKTIIISKLINLRQWTFPYHNKTLMRVSACYLSSFHAETLLAKLRDSEFLPDYSRLKTLKSLSIPDFSRLDTASSSPASSHMPSHSEHLSTSIPL